MKSLSILSPELKKYYKLILLSSSLAIPLSAIKAGIVPLIKVLIDDLTVGSSEKNLITYGGILILLFLLNFFVRFGHYYLMRVAISKIVASLKMRLFQHLSSLSADYFTKKSVGHLMSRLGSDPQYIESAIACIGILMREPLTFLLLAGYAFYLHWQLSVLIFLILPLLFWIFTATAKNLKRYLHKMTEENANIYSTAQETFSGIRLIQSFQLEASIQQRFRKQMDRFVHATLKTAAVEELSHPLVELITSLAIAAVVIFGGFQVYAKTMTTGDLIAIFTAFGFMLDPLRRLNDINIKLNQAIAASIRLQEIFDYKSHITLPLNQVSKKIFSTDVVLKEIFFSYPDQKDHLILKNINCTFKKGQTTAIVGSSGSGKSSLLQLLPRIFDPTSGIIMIDSIPHTQIVLEDLRKLYALVSQDVFLFNSSIEDNIRSGNLQASFDDIYHASLHAGILPLIEKLPFGFKTTIGDRGVKLSGGERQRLSIARAFVKNAPILILDEATSQLDSQTENEIQIALQKLSQDRTTIIVAHRLSTVKNAEYIYVLEQGSIFEEGTHDSLFQKRGRYYDLSHIGRS